MGVSIIVGECDGEAGAWLYDRTSGRALGPRFRDYEDADAFQSWLAAGGGALVGWDGPRDPRRLPESGPNSFAEAIAAFREDAKRLPYEEVSRG